MKKKFNILLTLLLLVSLLSTSIPAWSINVQAQEDIPENGTIMQYFEWFLPNNGHHWDNLAQNAIELDEVGITSVWIPPAYKGHVGSNDVGYGVYDLYDLGEFNQKGSVRTKYGTKQQLQNAISKLQSNDIEVYGDVVVNHFMGADYSESVRTVEVAGYDRNNVISGPQTRTVWTGFDFPGRDNQYSSFDWKWYHFDGVDSYGKIYRFENQNWDWTVSTEFGNYDYLMGADLDFGHPEVIDEINNWGTWYVNELGLDGLRLDAVKHIKYEFMSDFVDQTRNRTGKDLFVVGEFFGGLTDINNYLDTVDYTMSMFDFPLRNNLAAASSSNGNFDMRRIADGTLLNIHPMNTVTFVENHDTQPDRDDAHAAEVQEWFKPLAYAYILTREAGYPKVFYGDYYGTNGTNGKQINSLKDKLDPLLMARKEYAYGPQHDYLDHEDLIGWTREGIDSRPNSGLATVMTNRNGGSKNMYVGQQHAGEVWYDITGNRSDKVTIDSTGHGNFHVNSASVSVWVSEDSQTGGGNNTVTIYYQHGFDTPHVHYRPEGGTWTQAPGVGMNNSEYNGYSELTINIGDAQRLEVAFNDGKGNWDSNNMSNYLFEVGDNTYIPGTSGGPGTIVPGKPQVGNTVTVYYKHGYSTPYIHYRPEGGTWTQAPGVRMLPSEYTGYSVLTIDIGTSTRLEAAFNDGNGNWDSNNMLNYFFSVGEHVYVPGVGIYHASTYHFQ